jgi:tripartite-type tricarboxylate transporter receptor subunit TctC
VAAALVPSTASSVYPERPVRIIIGHTGGDTTDLVARVAARALAKHFSQPFIVDNYPGANSNLAAARAAKAKPDGHTLLLVSPAFSSNTSLYSRLTHQPLQDFVPVARIANIHNVLVVRSSLGVGTVADLIAAVRSRPGKMILASSGTGSVSHLAAEFLKIRARPFNALHVPYRGNGAAMVDLLNGTTDALFASVPFAYPHARTGRITALAVASPKRAPQLAEVPTFAEAGIPEFEAYTWSGLVAPAGTPYDPIVRLHLGIMSVLTSPAVNDQLKALGAEPVAETPEVFADYLRAETAKWARVIKAANINIEFADR